MKTKTWIFLLLGLFLLCLGLALRPLADAPYARITSRGQVLCTLDLRIDQELTVSTPEGGENVITVRSGKISVTSANCPDGCCMAQGFCSSGQIVCLPNRLVISFTRNAPIDAVSG